MTHHGQILPKTPWNHLKNSQVGKTFCGESLERDFGYCFHDGDQWLPEDLRETLKQGESWAKNLGESSSKQPNISKHSTSGTGVALCSTE